MTVMHALLGLFCVLAVANAPAHEDPARIRAAVAGYLDRQTQGLPGKVSFEVGQVDSQNQLVPCPALEVSQPAGSRAWGRLHLMVRCTAANGWSLSVPAQVRVIADHLVSARPLARGETVNAGDFAIRQGDLGTLPAGVVVDPAEAIGKILRVSIAAGLPLRSDMLQPQLVVRQNQTVQVVYRGQGFDVTNEGRALTQAADGEVVQVKLASGQVISGIARPGGRVDVGF